MIPTLPRPVTASPTQPGTGHAPGANAFALDITFLESSGQDAMLINLTDDGCGSTCPKACATNMG